MDQGDEADVPLVTNRENSHLVARHEKSIRRDVARLTIRDDELAQVALDASADQRVSGQAE